jgi:hypothetical protein
MNPEVLKMENENLTVRLDSAHELADAAVRWMDATVSTQYDAENKFWGLVQQYKDEKQGLATPR